MIFVPLFNPDYSPVTGTCKGQVLTKIGQQNALNLCTFKCAAFEGWDYNNRGSRYFFFTAACSIRITSDTEATAASIIPIGVFI